MKNNTANLNLDLQEKDTGDALLIAAIAQGDKVAFSQMMHRHLNPVIVFVMRYFPQRSDAEDIAQETFIRLWCKAPIWKDQGISVKAWLFRVSKNISIDLLRKQSLELKNCVDENIVDEHAFIENMISIEGDLEIQNKALKQLPERQRTAIMLCAVKGLSNIEAAVVMGTSVEALESLLARGRRKLKKIYKQAIEQQYIVNRGEINDFC